MSNALQPLAHLITKFFLDGDTYEVEHFKIGFLQPIDHKGQPQHETKGGQIQVILGQAPNNNLYDWAKRSTKLKSGEILFQTDLGMTILKIEFTNSYCISLARNIDEFSGTSTTLILAPEIIKLNGKIHQNHWKK